MVLARRDLPHRHAVKINWVFARGPPHNHARAYDARDHTAPPRAFSCRFIRNLRIRLAGYRPVLRGPLSCRRLLHIPEEWRSIEMHRQQMALSTIMAGTHPRLQRVSNFLDPDVRRMSLVRFLA